MKRSKKISVTLIFILTCLGTVYIFEILFNPTKENLGNLFWGVFAGIGFAYFFNFKFEVPLPAQKSKKGAKKGDKTRE